jgi:1,4-alpha-glucan branching enzyme
MTKPLDLHLFHEGRHFRAHDVLGAHAGEAGTRVATWAPNARGVSVIGDHNDWQPGVHELTRVPESGIWAGPVPGLGVGHRYKLHVATDTGAIDKADPFAFATEVPPLTASVVADLGFEWHDEDWMRTRAARNALDAPISIYEVHIGSWRRGADGAPLGYRELGPALADHVERLGFTHVELLPIMEHPFSGSWGYQTTGYFAPTARHGTPADLMAMIDHLHGRGIGVILDWVPSHFPADGWGLARFDGTPLFEDERAGLHPDWNTLQFDYARPEVRSFLISSANFWLERYHVDGIRVDAVASMLYLDYSRGPGQWTPNEHGGRENLHALHFLRELNEEVYRSYPDVQTYAEESTAWPMVSRPTYLGGLGFGFKWDMGWMHDTLQYFERDPVHRRFHHGELTFRAIYGWSENFVLPLSHDEVVHGKGSLLAKMPGDDWQRFANLRLLLGYQATLPGKTLLFMGAELAPWREWDHDGELEWFLADLPTHGGVGRWLADLNRTVRAQPALHQRDVEPDGFAWVIGDDSDHSTFAYLRFGARGEPALVVLNATPVPRTNVFAGVPEGGRWIELLNSDAQEYGGSGAGNDGGVDATPIGRHGQPWSLTLTVPPLGVVVLAPEPLVAP